MNPPKVEFKIASLNQTFPLIHHFLNPAKGDWDWSDSIYKNYPKLKAKLENIKNRKKRHEIEYNFFTEIFRKERSELEKKQKLSKGNGIKLMIK